VRGLACMSTVSSRIYMSSTQHRVKHSTVSFFLSPVSSRLTISTVSAARKVISTLRRNIDHALHRKHEGEITQHVASIVLVKAVPFYGYNVGWRLYCKIYLFDPRLIARLSKLLSAGAIMKQQFLIYEAHINYVLQFLTDFNLYGCGFLECHQDKLKYRRTSSDDQVMTALETLPEDVFPRHSYRGWEVDICAPDILNRNRVEARNIHQNFEERHEPHDDIFKYVNSLDELWKFNGFTPNQPKDLWTMPSTIRGDDHQVQWTREQEFRERLGALLNGECRTGSIPGLKDGIPGEKYIPTAFESIDYMSSFHSGAVNARGKSKQNAAIRDSSVLDLDMNAVQHLNSQEDLDFPDLNGDSEGGELLEEDVESQDEELQQEEFEQERFGGNANAPPSDTRDPVTDGATSDLSDDPRTRPNALVGDETTHHSRGIARASEPQDRPSVSPGLPGRLCETFEFTKTLPASATLPHEPQACHFPALQIRAAFRMDTRPIIYIPDLPPSVSDVNKSIEEFGMSRALCRDAFFGVPKDVPRRVREYGGTRLRLYSNDYVHLPMFSPMVTRRPGNINSPACPVSLLWRLLSVPPGRSEALSSLRSGGHLEEMGDGIANRPSPRDLSQIEGPTQANSYGTKYLPKPKATGQSGGMSIMSLELHGEYALVWGLTAFDNARVSEY